MKPTNTLEETVQDMHKKDNHIPYELLDQEYGLYVEDYFNKTLCLERKRSERTHKPILLLLINVEQIISDDGTDKKIQNIVKSLTSSIREVDLCGWYERGTVIGVMFTAFSGESIWDTIEAIANKIKANLAQTLSPAVLAKLELIFHVFPEKFDKQKPKNYLNPTFYPDMAKLADTTSMASVIKRGMDILGSIVGLVLFSPFFIAIPLLIKITSPGPVLFRQERVGQFGRRFTFLKFRSMHMNNDDKIHREFLKQLISGDMKNAPDGGGTAPVFKITNDPRITPLGRFIRKTSIDELPQFINVLRGEMSLVGPRPPIPYEFEDYDIWHRYRLLKMKPGITGLWQVTGRSSTTFDAMVRLDINYIRNWSLWLDIKILCLTPLAVFKCRGAY
ncbi:sugar transferase [Geobacter sp. AOG1]|uniref:sugar transferase n=1 Tax=Geobacter sp. AOG1 TaxID=1566346 RepID=UPI001CC3E904|nr:sugar transferase [Geobacter sp. AOG1]GFE58362.1 hypothetical protein AOG1_22420 [Geobacter sp. AOG1]